MLKAIELFDLGPPVREGDRLQVDGSLSAGLLARRAVHADGSGEFVVETVIDPETVYRARAESDVVAGEILKQPVTFEAALGERRKEPVSGTITIVLQADPAGNVRRRTKVTKLVTRKADGQTETETLEEVVERRPL